MEKYYAGKNVLILGGFGYIGKHLVKKLSDFNANVTIIARDAGPGSSKHKKYTEIYNVANVFSIDPLVDFESLQKHINKSNIVLNLIYGKKHDLNYQQNVVTFNFKLLQYCQENNLNPVLVHFGSRLQYAKDCPNPIKENSTLKPTTVYGFGKLMSEKYYQFFNQHFGLRTICLRLSNVYGSCEDIPFKKNTVDILIHSALHDTITCLYKGLILIFWI